MFHVYKTVFLRIRRSIRRFFIERFSSSRVARAHAHKCAPQKLQIIVAGGGTDSIEILDVDQRPLQWIRSNAVLPFSVFGHSCVDYEGKLILIGGYNANHGI